MIPDNQVITGWTVRKGIKTPVYGPRRERTPMLLTAEEKAAVILAANGYTDASIATALDVSFDAARGFMRRAQRKVGARNRAHTVANALRRGEIDTNDIWPPDSKDTIPVTPGYCAGFPEECPNIVPVPAAPPQHAGGVRCGCHDTAAPAERKTDMKPPTPRLATIPAQDYLRYVVRSALTHANLSQEEVARRLSMTPQHLSRLMTGACGLSLYNAERILTELGMRLQLSAVPDGSEHGQRTYARAHREESNA